MNNISKTIVADVLISSLEQIGFKARLVSIQRLDELQAEVEARYAEGQLADEFYQERLKFYRFNPPDDLPSPKSIIVVAIPRPQTPVSFTVKRNNLTLTLPPTYAAYNETIRNTGELLNEIIVSFGHKVAPAALPLKLLAARSGLVEYGRNNICYIPGMGSFFQLAGYYSDIPCQADTWQEPHMMDRCVHCRACQKTCPTGAIAPDRFLLHAERCLVFHNERPASHPFPSWIDTSVHQCLMGCMLCQQICPENKSFMGWYEAGVDFSAEETALLLRGASSDELAADTRRKLEILGLIDDLDKLPRNISVIWKQRGVTAQKAGLNEED